jgi:hypothetical protein
MLTAIRKAVAKRLEILVEAMGLVASFSGTALAVFLGKLFLAAILGALTLGFFFRITGRRSASKTVPPPTPSWAFMVSGLLSLALTAVLVEATNLPVRFNQEQFDLLHWVLVILAVIAAFFLLLQLIRTFLAKRHARAAP